MTAPFYAIAEHDDEYEKRKKSANYHISKNISDRTDIPENFLTVNKTCRKTYRKVEEQFIRYDAFEDADFIPMYLDSMIHYWANELFGDGTWSVIRNLDYRQIYIFCVNFQHLQKTFNMPVLYVVESRNQRR